MRNLKRALSLALAAMMLIGMMVVSAGAASKDFTDSDEIQHKEAVNTMVALNVIAGKEDGSYFDPTGTLTRAEMAKVISYVMNGGVEPNIGTKVNPTYSDIKGHWAEAYIEYCTSMGIINGDGAGKFNPEGTLTASQAAKMFLTAMGYNATVFGFTGNSWETNTNRYANEAGLYEDLGNVSVSAPISRDDACQMAYNAIQAKMMERDWSLDPATGEMTEGYKLGTSTLLGTKFGAKTFIGSYTGNDKTISSLADGQIQVYGKLDTDDGTSANQQNRYASFPSDMSISNIGEQVKVIFKDGNGGQDNRPDKNDTIYGVFNTGASEVINATQGDVKDLKSDKAQINIGDVKYDVQTDITGTTDTEGVTVITNYVGSGTSYTGNDLKGSSSANSKLTSDLKAANGNTIKAIVNPDTNKIDTIYITTSKVAVVTAVNDEKISLNNGVGTIKVADNEVYEGVTKGDVVVVTTLYANKATDDGAYTIVTKAETISGEVNSYKGTETVKLDDTVYTVYNKTTMPTAGLDDAVASFGDGSIGESYTLYMVNGYVGMAVQTSESANNYSVVTDKNSGNAGSTFNALELEVLAADGTKSIITVSDDSAVTTSAGYEKGDIIVYTGDASDAVVTIKGDYDKTSPTKIAYNDDTKAINGAVTSSDCVLFVHTDNANSYKAYNVRDLKSFGDTDGVAVKNSDGKVVAAYIDLKDTPDGATSNTVYGIVTSYNGREKVDDTHYYSWTVASNDETYTVYMNENTTLGTSAGKLVAFDPASDNVYKTDEMDVVNNGGVYVKEYSEGDGTLTYYTNVVNGDGGYVGTDVKTLALDDDAMIVYVDADNDAAGSDIGINAFDSVTGYKNAAVVLNNNGDKIVAIFVETSGECDILSAGVTDAGFTSDDVKALEDGVYVPTVKGEVCADATLSVVEDLRIFKYTAPSTAKYTLKLYVGDQAVYTETTSSNVNAGDAYFYIDVDAQWHWNAGITTDKGDAEKNPCPFTAGETYKYEITTGGNTVVAEGTFEA